MGRTTDNKCPYCGGTAHRKAVQKLKGEPKAYRRMYCADGCGHYHYRDVDTNAIVEVGQGPRVYRHAATVTESFDDLALTLGIIPSALKFTSEVDGRPRVIALCLSDADLSTLSREDGEKVKQLHQTLLTIQACVGVYRRRASGKSEDKVVELKPKVAAKASPKKTAKGKK